MYDSELHAAHFDIVAMFAHADFQRALQIAWRENRLVNGPRARKACFRDRETLPDHHAIFGDGPAQRISAAGDQQRPRWQPLNSDSV